MLVIFATPQGMWREFQLPVTLPSQLSIDRHPLTKPLSILLDEFPSYCVLVTDSRNARVFLLTQGRIAQEFDTFIQDYVQERVAGQLSADPKDKGEVLRQKALEAAQAWERRHEMQLRDTLLERNNSGGLAILGVEPVLEALSFGQVHTLIIDHDLHIQGTICPEDQTLSTYMQTCPICGRDMLQTEDLTEEIVQAAIRRKRPRLPLQRGAGFYECFAL